jgi:hypothetical protein
MRILKELAVAVPVLLLLLLLSGTFLGSAATPTVKSPAWIGAEMIPTERLLFDESILTGASWQGTYPDSVPSNFLKRPRCESEASSHSSYRAKEADKVDPEFHIKPHSPLAEYLCPCAQSRRGGIRGSAWHALKITNVGM